MTQPNQHTKANQGKTQATKKDGSEDMRHQGDHGQGQVKNPKTDGRLKENR